MRALIVDAGNTRVTCVAWEGSGQLPSLAQGPGAGLSPPVPLRDLGSVLHPGAEGEEAFRRSFLDLHEEVGRPPVVLVSVLPRVAELLGADIDLVAVDHTSSLPFTLDVAEPSLVGPDRLCNVAAAAGAGLTDALVVDAGTATTFDLLVGGVFIGGLIAPGMAFAAGKLGEFAARLEPVPFGPVGWDVGRDTSTAMAAGAWHAGIGGIRSVVAGLGARYGEFPVVVTGGLGTHLQEPGWFFDPHWTFRGAAILSKL